MNALQTRILHVTEAMSTGVLSFLDSISRHQVEQGASVDVLYTVRPETPHRPSLEARFDERVTLLPPIDLRSGPRNAVALFLAVRAHARSGSYDVIHLHSSIAGGVGRLAVVGVRQQVAYSPHGFAFLREDSPSLVRQTTKFAERYLARRAALIVTSQSEVEIATSELRAPTVQYLKSGVSRASVEASNRGGDRAGPRRVAMLGRIAYQKAPWRFAAIARELADLAEFVWVGGGDDADRERWIGDAPVTVHGWVTPARLDELLAQTDILLFPTLWEGMSLSLIQAQGRGIPVVTSDVAGNRDAVDHGVTGYVCTTDGELIAATRRLLGDPELLARMSAASRVWVVDNFTDDAIGSDSLLLYQQARRTAA